MSERAWGTYICLAVALAPLAAFVPIPYTDVWYSAYIGLFAALMLAVAVYLWPFSWLLSLLSGWALFSAIFVSQQHPKAMLLIIQLNMALIAIRKISELSAVWRRRVLYAMLFVYYVQVVMISLQSIGSDPVFNSLANPLQDDTVGISGSKNQVGLFFAVTAPMAVSFHPALGLMNLLGVCLSKTTIAAAAFFISMSAYVFMHNKFLGIIALTMLCVLIAVYLRYIDDFSEPKLRERKELILSSVRDVERGYAKMRHGQAEMTVTTNRWLGFGLGNFMRVSPYTQYDFTTKHNLGVGQEAPHHVYEHAHNDYVENWYELGRTGFIITLGLVLKFFTDFIKAYKTKILKVCFCAVLAHLICALGIYTIQTAISGLCLMVFYGLFMGEVRCAKRPIMG